MVNIYLMVKKISLIFILLSMAACSNDNTEQQLELKFMAAEQSGAWYPLAVGITQVMVREMPELGNVSILPGGGISNVIGIDQGQAQIGFSQASSVIDALAGNPPFKTQLSNITYLLSLFPHKTHIVAPANSGINTIEDLAGKRVNVGTKGLLTEDIARRILDAYGMTYDDMGSVQNLSFSDSVVQMKDGRLDAMFWTSPAPFAVLSDLSLSVDIKFLTLPEDKIAALSANNPGLTRAIIPAGTYHGVNNDVITIQSPIVLIANNQTTDDIAYFAARSVFEGLEELRLISPYLNDMNAEDLIHDFGIPVHPGARKYLTEIGRLK